MTLSAQLIIGVSWALGEIKVNDNGKNQQSLSPYNFKECTKKRGSVPLSKDFKGLLSIL